MTKRQKKMNDKKILIIDDEPDVIMFLTAILEEHSYSVFSVSDIKKAMSSVEENKPDLICLDIMMPKETGISFYSKLRQENSISDIPVIIISGAIESGKFNFHSFVDDKSIPVPDGFLEKPIKVNEFINLVDTLISDRIVKE
jgi:CheY-like chemotaxis protein